jgi:hypothetical protein
MTQAEPLSLPDWIHLAESFCEMIAREMGYRLHKVKRAKSSPSVYLMFRGRFKFCVRLSDHHTTHTGGQDRLFSVKFTRSARLGEFRKWLMVLESKQRQEEPAPKTAEHVPDVMAQT